MFHKNLYAMGQIFRADGFGKLIYSEGEYFFHGPNTKVRTQQPPTTNEGPVVPGLYLGWRDGLPPQWYPTHSNVSDLTWQAYNKWPARDSLYDDGSTSVWYTESNVRVSFDRPYAKYCQMIDAPLSAGSGEFLLWEHPMVFWLELWGRVKATFLEGGYLQQMTKNCLTGF